MINTLLELGIIVLLFKVIVLLGIIINLKKKNTKYKEKYEYWRQVVLAVVGTDRLQKELDEELAKNTTRAPWLNKN